MTVVFLNLTLPVLAAQSMFTEDLCGMRAALPGASSPLWAVMSLGEKIPGRMASPAHEASGFGCHLSFLGKDINMCVCVCINMCKCVNMCVCVCV